MLTSEERATKTAMWLAHWNGWKDSGESLAAYARRQGFDADAAYRWKRILRRGGQWIDDVPPHSNAVPRRKAVKFARVALSDSPRTASMLLRISFSNGRRAELDLADVSQLGAVIAALEQAA
jgi:hypothetical protein